MKIFFRTDASLEIGTGHVMRCLTLSKALRDHGGECIFVCREHKGNFIKKIRQEGFECIALDISNEVREMYQVDGPSLLHVDWLGANWEEDARQTMQALSLEDVDWLVVDHYALDRRWEEKLRLYTKKIMVIDDLADRHHDCDLLLDQNIARNINCRYKDKIPRNCVSLLGPEYALLRPEFAGQRKASLARRIHPRAEQLFVCLGGSDPENETVKVVEALSFSKKVWKRIDVVVGESYPYQEELREKLRRLENARLHIQTPKMAQLMLYADLAFTAGGSISWEKCCLGLPSFVVIQCQNQSEIAVELHALGAQKTLGWGGNSTAQDYAESLNALVEDDLVCMTAAASHICDGTGTKKVVKQMRSQL